MKIPYWCLIANALLVCSCATCGPFDVGNSYGAPVPYGEGRHPGIDFDIKIGTPIIAASDGVVVYIGEPDSKYQHGGGIFVGILQGEYFVTLYGHLTKIFVEKGESLRRGQLIALSGASNSGYAHLHFGVCKVGGNCRNYSETYDPNRLWLGGEAQCFDPRKDYSREPQESLTLPVACGEYAREVMVHMKDK